MYTHGYVIPTDCYRLQKQLSAAQADHGESISTLEDKYKSEMQSFKQRMAALESTSSELQKEVHVNTCTVYMNEYLQCGYSFLSLVTVNT